MVTLVETRLPADLLRPRSLAMLMGIYECNYRRLMQLLGDPLHLPAHRRLRLGGRPALYVELGGRSRYTVDLILTHRFAGERLPDLTVRLYRDARLAEALPQSGPADAGNPLARLPARWQANMLLYKWLEYCLDAACGMRVPVPEAI
jgi:uncharacterized protein YqiB (DUF1249 family)